VYDATQNLSSLSMELEKATLDICFLGRDLHQRNSEHDEEVLTTELQSLLSQQNCPMYAEQSETGRCKKP
jgi:hypothetical protein